MKLTRLIKKYFSSQSRKCKIRLDTNKQVTFKIKDQEPVRPPTEHLKTESSTTLKIKLNFNIRNNEQIQKP